MPQSQPKKRVRITPQKGINQVTQTSPELMRPRDEDSNSTTLGLIPENDHHDHFQQSLFSSTAMDGRATPHGLGMMEQVSVIATPDGHPKHRIYPSFLVSDEGSDKENASCDEDELDLSMAYIQGSSVKRVIQKPVEVVVSRLEDNDNGRADADTDPGIGSYGSMGSSDAEAAPNAGITSGRDSNTGYDSTPVNGTVHLLHPSFSAGAVFGRLKRKLTLSLSESKFLSNPNTPLNLQNTSVQESAEEELNKHNIYARSVLRLRQAMSSALDAVSPRLRNGSPLFYVTEELIHSIRLNILRTARDRKEVNLSGKIFKTEEEYLTINESIIPGANGNNQCALCATGDLSITGFAGHKLKHIISTESAEAADTSTAALVVAFPSITTKTTRRTPVRVKNNGQKSNQTT